MNLGFAGKKALVTAGSAGIGLEVARRLAEGGADVAICGRDPERLEHGLKLLRGAGGRTLAVRADLSQEAEVRHG